MGFLSFSRLPAAELLRLDLGGNVVLDLLKAPAGTFRQGSLSSESNRGEGEDVREVRISKAFWLGKTPITVKQWTKFVQDSNYRSEAEDGKSGGFGWDGQKLTQAPQYTWKNPGFTQTPEHPVTMITWFDAQTFVNWLTTKTGHKASLPTEAQWEYACRAGTASAWPVANVDQWAWHLGNAQYSTHPVALLQANAWGFSDMAGQVYEWCEDWFAPYVLSPQTDPLQANQNLSDKPRRVLRGGSFLKSANFGRSAARFRNDPRSRNADNGFRVAVAVQPNEVTTTTDAVAATTPLPPPIVLPGTLVAVPEPISIASTVGQEIEIAPTPEPTPNLSEPSPTQEQTPSSFSASLSSSPSAPPAPSAATAAPDLHLAEIESPAPSKPWWLWGLLAVPILFLLKKLRPTTTRRARSYRGYDNSHLASTRGTSTTVLPPKRHGFWVKENWPVGTSFRWTCRTEREMLEGDGNYEPSERGMFVYTGLEPLETRVIPQLDVPPTSGSSFSTGLHVGSAQSQIYPPVDSNDKRAPDSGSPEAPAPSDSKSDFRYPSAY